MTLEQLNYFHSRLQDLKRIISFLPKKLQYEFLDFLREMFYGHLSFDSDDFKELESDIDDGSIDFYDSCLEKNSVDRLCASLEDIELRLHDIYVEIKDK